MQDISGKNTHGFMNNMRFMFSEQWGFDKRAFLFPILFIVLEKPSSGRILMNGVDINEFNRDEYYSMITAVFQNVSLLPMSIAWNITFCQDNDFDKQRL